MADYIAPLEAEITKLNPEDAKKLVLKRIPFQRIQPATKDLLVTYQSLLTIKIVDCDLRTLQNFPMLLQLQELYLSKNKLQGTIYYLRPFRRLKYVDLSSNIIRKSAYLTHLERDQGMVVRVQNNPFTRTEPNWRSILLDFGLIIENNPRGSLTGTGKYVACVTKLQSILAEVDHTNQDDLKRQPWYPRHDPDQEQREYQSMFNPDSQDQFYPLNLKQKSHSQDTRELLRESSYHFMQESEYHQSQMTNEPKGAPYQAQSEILEGPKFPYMPSQDSQSEYMRQFEDPLARNLYERQDQSSDHYWGSQQSQQSNMDVEPQSAIWGRDDSSMLRQVDSREEIPSGQSYSDFEQEEEQQSMDDQQQEEGEQSSMQEQLEQSDESSYPSSAQVKNQEPSAQVKLEHQQQPVQVKVEHQQQPVQFKLEHQQQPVQVKLEHQQQQVQVKLEYQQEPVQIKQEQQQPALVEQQFSQVKLEHQQQPAEVKQGHQQQLPQVKLEQQEEVQVKVEYQQPPVQAQLQHQGQQVEVKLEFMEQQVFIKQEYQEEPQRAIYNMEHQAGNYSQNQSQQNWGTPSQREQISEQPSFQLQMNDQSSTSVIQFSAGDYPQNSEQNWPSQGNTDEQTVPRSSGYDLDQQELIPE